MGSSGRPPDKLELSVPARKAKNSYQQDKKKQCKEKKVGTIEQVKEKTGTALKVIAHDDHLVVVDKPSGLLAVPGRGPDRQDCVTRRVKRLFADVLDQPAVHRLDMDTSGLMVLALTAETHRYLSQAFAQRQVEKRYEAILDGTVDGREGEIVLRFRLDPDNRPQQVYDPVQGKEGITRWCLLGETAGRSRVLFMPLTGRTHQLRLHASHRQGLGVPIVGDRLYGSPRPGERLHLHATFLAFVHPGLNQRVEFHSAAPF